MHDEFQRAAANFDSRHVMTDPQEHRRTRRQRSSPASKTAGSSIGRTLEVGDIPFSVERRDEVWLCDVLLRPYGSDTERLRARMLAGRDPLNAHDRVIPPAHFEWWDEWTAGALRRVTQTHTFCAG